MSFQSDLEELEQVTQELWESTRPAPSARPDLVQVHHFLKRREALILRLAANTQWSPEEGDRLKSIYEQGQRAEANLNAHRRWLLTELSTGAAQRAYADCVGAIVRNAL